MFLLLYTAEDSMHITRHTRFCSFFVNAEALPLLASEKCLCDRSFWLPKFFQNVKSAHRKRALGQVHTIIFFPAEIKCNVQQNLHRLHANFGKIIKPCIGSKKKELPKKQVNAL